MKYSEYIEEASKLGLKVGPMLTSAGYSRHAARHDASRNDDAVSQRYIMLLDAVRYQQQAFNSDQSYTELVNKAYRLKDDPTVAAQLKALQAVVDSAD